MNGFTCVNKLETMYGLRKRKKLNSTFYVYVSRSYIVSDFIYARKDS